MGGASEFKPRQSCCSAKLLVVAVYKDWHNALDEQLTRNQDKHDLQPSSSHVHIIFTS